VTSEGNHVWENLEERTSCRAEVQDIGARREAQKRVLRGSQG